MRKLISGLLVCLFILSIGVAASPRAAQIGSVRFYGWSYDDAVFHVNVYGSGEDDADRARLSIWIPELGVYDISHSFTMQDSGPDGKLVLVHVDEKPLPGWYLVRTRLTSDDGHSVRWQWIWFG